MELVSRSPNNRNPNRKHFTGITDIPDNLLIEILLCLPLKSAKQCMLVSKLWYSLMSSPYFAHRFLEVKYSSALVLCYDDYDEYGNAIPRIIVPEQNSIIKSDLFSFSYLPLEKRAVPKLVAWCEDLVLCQVFNRVKFGHVYYICNPLTRSWIRVPGQLPFYHIDMSFGFVFQGSGHSFRYAVLAIPYKYNDDGDLRNYLKVYIFTSESGIWRKRKAIFRNEIIGYPEGSTACIPYKGMLFWVTTSNVLIGVDPFNEEGGFYSLIGLPPRFSDAYPTVGVCNGILRVFVADHDNETESLRIQVCNLKDNENREWHLNEITFPDLRQSKGIKWFENMRSMVELACEPKDDDIIYMYLGGSTVVSCNMREITLEVICQYQDPADDLGFDHSFVYEVPWQPTSIHSPPLQNRSHDV